MTWLETLKQLLGIPPEDTSQDAMIDFLAGIALRLVQERTGRSFVAGTYLDTFPGPFRTVYTNEFPINEVIEVADNGVILPSTDYFVEPVKGAVSLKSSSTYCVPDSYRMCADSLTVTYKANDPLPPDWLSLVVSDAIRASMGMMTAGNAYGLVANKVAVTDVGSIEFGAVGDSPAQALQQMVDGALENWILPALAFSSDCCNGRQTSRLLEAAP